MESTESTNQTIDQATKTLKGLFTNPSELTDIVSDPGKNGLAYLKALSNKDKQNLAFAAGIGLIIYGIVLNRKNR
ncbi:hypothetical protein AAE02nite_46980 [Adhaeribacter aerolatus]|uniref:Uncharacterized protein n=1 Tax=Adhaeribacter aerolatus TaxID=670289 RepID=A0A512B530_9BACT|nr:hypothetical protein [Adhaeribacter aerolatus]GEO07034.1 hypothetical protein AAE02nite_46980 [Adhaeribacter aerolatus]